MKGWVYVLYVLVIAGIVLNIPAPFTLTESFGCKKGLGKDDIKPRIEQIKHPYEPLKHR
jgi:hypothetical protein